MNTPLVKYDATALAIHRMSAATTTGEYQVYLAADVETVLARMAQAEDLLKLSFDALHHGGYVSPLQVAILKFVAPLGVITAHDLIIAEAQCLLARWEETP